MLTMLFKETPYHCSGRMAVVNGRMTYTVNGVEVDADTYCKALEHNAVRKPRRAELRAAKKFSQAYAKVLTDRIEAKREARSNGRR